MAYSLGGMVTAGAGGYRPRIWKTETYFDTTCRLFKNLPEKGVTWMSHGDYMARVPEGFSLTAHTDMCPTAAIADETRGFYGVQFHPEVNHTENGTKMLHNFLYEVCGAKGDWTMGDYCKTAVESIRREVGDGKVLLALSRRRGFFRSRSFAGRSGWQSADLRVCRSRPDAQKRGRRS